MINLFFYSILILIATSCGNKSKSHERVYPVKLGDVEQKDVPIYIESIGNVFSLQTVQIRPQVSGLVVEAYVQQGQYVKKGDPLYKIDTRPYQAALDRAKGVLEKDLATLEFSKIQLERNKQLAEKDYISKLTYEQYRSQVEINKGQVESDKADVALAELNLSWCIPTSPIDGKISQYNIDPGNLVVANDANALTNIRQISPADIRFNINQNDYVKVQKAMQKGSLKFEAILPQDKKTPREGMIYFVDNHIDPSTGTILLKGTVPNEDEMFWPGEFIRVLLQLRIEKQAILVPEQAVKIGQEGPFIYVYKPDTSTAEYRKVVKGNSIDGKFIIQSGVKLGEKVIVEGQNNLMPGTKVSLS